ncbi:OmpA family protein [Rhodobacteraceae bacterium W635]|uniref:OmpA family protein n=1 Tax=Nioella halotolerans TaxID=2303578 RepID=UPI000E3C09C5|nr:OmpA family protein [Rhodobacteraceae bacterium W635]
MNTRIRLMSLGLVSTLGLAACEPAYMQDPNQNRTRDGAIIGGMLGAFLGANADDDNQGRNALLGAAAGAAAGGAIGYSLDQQAADLRNEMSNENIVIDNQGDQLLVTMPQGILFDTDSAAIRASLQSDLRALARNVQRYPDSTIDVVGHTDNTGSAGYNQDLSARRATAVAGVLLEQGVAPSRVRSFGRGESEPVDTNLTPEGRQQNRRVEIFIRPTRN